MTKELRAGRVTLELTIGNIARQVGFEAVVNAANPALRTGSGVAGALHTAAGPQLAEEAARHAPIRPGQAVITSGYRLPNPWVIHCLGPVHGRDEPADVLLASCYVEALRIADARGIRSIAFPSISTGAYGYPMEAAARVALTTTLKESARLQVVERIRFVLYDEAALAAHSRVLEEIAATE